MSAPVELRGVTFGYRTGAPAVLDDVSLNVPAGQVTAVLGPSGSGKSTLLAVVAGIAAPWSGDVVIGGRTVTSVPANRRDVALVLQQPYLFPTLSVGQNVTFGLAARGMPRRHRTAIADRWLERVGLEGMARRRPRELSGGEQQRVALIRALATEPTVLLLDEPLANLDPGVRGSLQSALRDVVADTGVTAILVTHDLSEAMTLGSRTALLDHGRLVAEGPSQSMYERPPTRAAAALVGVTTFIDGTARDGYLDTPAGRLAVDGLIGSGPRTYAIRPEHVTVATGPGPNAIMGTTTDCIYRGEYWEVTVDTPLGAIRARAAWAVRVDDRTLVALPARHLVPLDDSSSA
jgi:ABC-type Fe3+/spermidine/putrescine transport system ATPase subunit